MCRAVRTWRGCVVGQHGTRSPPRRLPALDRTYTAIGRWHRLRKFIATHFELCGARPARFPPPRVSARRPRSTRAAQCGLSVVVLWSNAGRAPPYAIGRGATAPTPRLVAGTGFERSWPLRSNPLARDPRVVRCFPPRGTSADLAQSTRAAQCGLGVVVLWANEGALLPMSSAEALPN